MLGIFSPGFLGKFCRNCDVSITRIQEIVEQKESCCAMLFLLNLLFNAHLYEGNCVVVFSWDTGRN